MNNKSSERTFELADIDKQILKNLQDDGTLSLRSLAELIGCSVNTVRSHLNNMEKEGIILRTSAVLDCCKIGYQEMLILFLGAKPEVPIDKIFEELEKIKQINAIYQVTGEYPIMIIAKCISKEEQINVLEEIKKISGISEILSKVVLRRVKEDFRLDIQ